MGDRAGDPDPRRQRLRARVPGRAWHRDAKIYTIFEGTSEIQRLVIARRDLRGGRSADPVAPGCATRHGGWVGVGSSLGIGLPSCSRGAYDPQGRTVESLRGLDPFLERLQAAPLPAGAVVLHALASRRHADRPRDLRGRGPRRGGRPDRARARPRGPRGRAPRGARDANRIVPLGGGYLELLGVADLDEAARSDSAVAFWHGSNAGATACSAGPLRSTTSSRSRGGWARRSPRSGALG